MINVLLLALNGAGGIGASRDKSIDAQVKQGGIAQRFSTDWGNLLFQKRNLVKAEGSLLESVGREFNPRHASLDENNTGENQRNNDRSDYRDPYPNDSVGFRGCISRFHVSILTESIIAILFRIR